MNNRELYLLVTGLQTERSLEDYLRALWQIASRMADATPSADDVAEMLRRAAIEEPPAFDPRWLAEHTVCPEPQKGSFEDWEKTILYQIVDLRRMAEVGTLEDPERYFGVVSPSGARWYNFDPVTYLECAVRGTVGGYEADEVIVLIPDESGDDDSPVFDLDDFGWEQFTDMLWCGQFYE